MSRAAALGAWSIARAAYPSCPPVPKSAIPRASLQEIAASRAAAAAQEDTPLVAPAGPLAALPIGSSRQSSRGPARAGQPASL